MPADAVPRRVAAVIAVAVLACLGRFALAIGAVRDRVDAHGRRRVRAADGRAPG